MKTTSGSFSLTPPENQQAWATRPILFWTQGQMSQGSVEKLKGAWTQVALV